MKIHFKIIILLTLVFIFSFWSIGQDTTSLNPNGYNKFHYEDGTLASEGFMENGTPNGYWKNYYRKRTFKIRRKSKKFPARQPLEIFLMKKDK